MPSDLDRLKAALADRYEIEREIGSGGMATVYLATDLRHERQVALKVLRPDLAESLGPKRFLQEVRVTANLQHPHILPLFDSGSADGFLFYVMPFIEGESLRERLAREGELPVAEAARILRDVVDALATAHRAGVVHRDIKPENVLLSGRHALVADFGVAKAVTEATGRHLLTTMGVALGTPYYMAPEQAAADKNIDHRADIYSIGAMAYELLAGRPPFTGPNAQAVLTAQVTKKPDPVSEHRASVPAALEQLIMRCLEKKAADRWQAADEMLPYLEAAATPSGGITPTDMHPVTLATSPLGRLPRWTLPAGALGVAAVTSVWALGGGWGMRGEPTETSATAPASGAAASSPDAGPELDSLRVVVLPFENRTGDPAADVWGELVAEEATRRLTQGASYLDVPTQGAVRSADHASGADPGAVARSFGARYVVSGRYSTLGDQVRFDADVSDALTGQLATAIDPVTAGRDAIQDAVEVVGERAAVAAAAYARPNPGALTLRGLHPPSTFESLDRYISAGEAFCRNDYDQVLAELENLIESDPAFIPARLMALPTYNNGGRSRLSRDSLRALARAALPRMTRVERINYTWLTSGSEEERLSAAQELDGLGAWAMSAYPVAFSAFRLNRVGTAAEAVERIPYDDPCYSQWPALWSARVTAHHLSGNHETELEHAREAVRRFPRDASRVGQLGAAAAAAGRLAVADSAVEMLVALPVDANEIVNQLVIVGHELAAHGHAGPAARVYPRAYEVAVQRTAPGSAARANAAVWAFAPAEALPVVQAAAAAAPDDAIVHGLLGTTLARLGRMEEAKAAAERSFELAPAGRWPVVVAAVAEGPRSAVEAMRRTLDAGGVYFHVGNLFLHYMPPLVEIADDPTWRALVAAR